MSGGIGLTSIQIDHPLARRIEDHQDISNNELATVSTIDSCSTNSPQQCAHIIYLSEDSQNEQISSQTSSTNSQSISEVTSMSMIERFFKSLTNSRSTTISNAASNPHIENLCSPPNNPTSIPTSTVSICSPIGSLIQTSTNPTSTPTSNVASISHIENLILTPANLTSRPARVFAIISPVENLFQTSTNPTSTSTSTAASVSSIEHLLQTVATSTSTHPEVSDDPPPYSEVPIETIPIPYRDVSTSEAPTYSQPPLYTIPLNEQPSGFREFPPPYHPSMRNSRHSIRAHQNNQPEERNRFGCKPDTLLPCEFVFCSTEPLVVIIALAGAYLFILLAQQIQN